MRIDTSSFDLTAYMAERARAVDEALGRFLPPESAPPETLHKAMRYSVFAGGKRLRPVLVIAGAEAVGGRMDDVMPTACAVEMIHTYSLIHDDLPAMDNDDFRRGSPTNHKVFGEALAILAGDALLTLAFRLLADNVPPASSGARLHGILVEIADAAGSPGMVGGQVADIESEGKRADGQVVDYIHTHKTAALIRASIRSGAILAGATLAFQIMDDILDVTATSEELGKTAGKDQAQQKATYPAVHGIEASRRRAQALVVEAHAALEPFGPRALPLRALGTFFIERRA